MSLATLTSLEKLVQQGRQRRASSETPKKRSWGSGSALCQTRRPFTTPPGTARSPVAGRMSTQGCGVVAASATGILSESCGRGWGATVM
eukprot:s6113_g3.t1